MFITLTRPDGTKFEVERNTLNVHPGADDKGRTICSVDGVVFPVCEDRQEILRAKGDL